MLPSTRFEAVKAPTWVAVPVPPAELVHTSNDTVDG